VIVGKAAEVDRPGSFDGSGVWGIRRDGSDGTGTIAGTGRNPRAIVCTSRGGSRRWVSVARRTRSVDLASSERRKTFPFHETFRARHLTIMIILQLDSDGLR